MKVAKVTTKRVIGMPLHAWAWQLNSLVLLSSLGVSFHLPGFAVSTIHLSLFFLTCHFSPSIHTLL